MTPHPQLTRRRRALSATLVAAATAITALVLVSSSRDASAAANLVTNGDFASSTTGWMAFLDASLTWASGPTNDADANATSGSVQVDWTNADGYAQAIAEQTCVLLPGAAGTYELIAASKLIATNDVNTTARVRVELFTNGTCSTLDTTVYTSTNSARDDAWHAVTNTGVAVLSTHLSARVQLLLEVDPLAPAPQRGYFDNVSFSNGPVDTPTPTPTHTPTLTPTPTNTPTPTDTPTPTNTPTPTDTPLPTDTPTNTPAPTDTPTSTQTNTPSPATATNTAVPTATNTPAATNTPGATTTPDAANTPDATSTAAVIEAGASEPPVVGPPPASSIDPANGDGVSAGDAAAVAKELPEEGNDGAAPNSSRTIALLITIAAGAAAVLPFAAARRRWKRR